MDNPQTESNPLPAITVRIHHIVGKDEARRVYSRKTRQMKDETKIKSLFALSFKTKIYYVSILTLS